MLEVLKYTLSKIPLRIVAIAPNLAYVTGLTHVKKKTLDDSVRRSAKAILLRNT